MSLDTSALKRRANEIIRKTNPKVLNVALAYLLLTLLFSLLSSKALGVNYKLSNAEEYMKSYMNGDYGYALKYLETLMPPAGAYAIDALLNLVMSIVGAGFIIFLLNAVRDNSPCLGNLLDGFGFFIKIIALNILQALIIGLWSLLLILPGIIAYYRYRQAIYILVDDPTKSPLQCLAESREMMSGHKAELFRLDLSFIGWYICAALPVVGYAVRVWTTPYIGLAKALFYERLRGDLRL